MRLRASLVISVALTAMIVGVPHDPTAQAAQHKRQDFSKTIQEGRQAARSALRETKATSVSVALVAGGKTVWSQGFGRAGPGKKPSHDTMYGIGSVSKMVTAIAVMQLVDQSRISLDAPVVRYVPDFSMLSPQYRQITVRMLLNHSAGLPGSDYSDALSSQPIPDYPGRVLSGLRNSHLKTTPGAMNVYCNDCFTLAGVVVERVSGMSLQDYVTEKIFKPLRMKDSRYPSSVPAQGSYAPVITSGRPEPFEVANVWASGGVLSTSDDMARLAMIFTGNGVVGGRQILSDAAVRQMGVDQTTTTLRVGPPGDFRFGLGWDTVADPALGSAGVRGWAKGGDIGQYHAGLVVAPDHGLAAVVEGAGRGFSSGSAETIAHTVLLNALVDSGAIDQMPKTITGKPAKAKVKTKAMQRKIKRATGIFLAQGTSARVTESKNESIKLSVTSDGKWTALPGRFQLRDDGAFWGTQTALSVRTVRAWDRTYLIQRRLGGTGTYFTESPAGQKTRSQGALSPTWQARVGKKWLLADENPTSANWTNAGTPAVEFASIPGLTGYLLATGALVESVPFDATTSEAVGTMFLEVPYLQGRDLYDFAFSMPDGASTGQEELLSFSSSVLRPAATVPTLAMGSSTVSIGSLGLVEWRRVPTASRVTLSGQSDWKLFDEGLSLLDTGGGAAATKQAPAGAYVAVFGPAGSAATVTVE